MGKAVLEDKTISITINILSLEFQFKLKFDLAKILKLFNAKFLSLYMLQLWL